MITIRPATHDDLAALTDIYNEPKRSTAPDLAGRRRGKEDCHLCLWKRIRSTPAIHYAKYGIQGWGMKPSDLRPKRLRLAPTSKPCANSLLDADFRLQGSISRP